MLVTHDRYFLDKVATAILAFEGQGKVVRYPGNFETYRSLRPQLLAGSAAPPAATPIPPAPSQPVARRPGKLSYREQRELEGMEASIEGAEAGLRAAETELSDPLTYRMQPARVPELKAALARAGAEVDRLYARWQELQSFAGEK
jgi:ATP-binding cassette subfamily F protein uup